MDGEIIEAEPSGKWKLAIVLLPAFLLLSAGGAVWFHWHQGRNVEIDARLALQSSALNAKELQGHFTKLTDYIGPRGWDSEEEVKGLRRTLAYLEGTLSPQNYGFRVQRANGLSLNGDLWPVLWVELEPKEGATKWMVVDVAYDQKPEDLAIVLAVLNEMRGMKYARGIRFVFSDSYDERGREGERLDEGQEVRNLRDHDTAIMVQNLGGVEMEVSLVRGDPKIDFEAEPLPAGEIAVTVEGSGGDLPEEALLLRAQWFRDFLRKAASRP
jgi:hypothetical protein